MKSANGFGRVGVLAAVMLLAVPPALADTRTQPTSLVDQGFARFNRGDVRGARIEAMKALKANPSNALARILSARVMLEVGNGVAAQTELEKAAAAGFPRDKTHHLMAHALLLQRQFQRAMNEADSSVVPEQFASYAARMRGRVQVALAQTDRARAEFELAQRITPRDPEALIDLGRFQAMNGEAAAGEALVDQALAIDKTNMKGLLLKGDMVRGRAGLEPSLPFFNQALQVDPNSVEALLERAGTLGDLRREDESRADLKKIQGLVPNHPLGLYLEAVLEARAGRYAAANALMTRTKGAINSYPPALMLQGMLAYQLNNMQQAEAFLGKVVAQIPQSELARKLYAAVQLRKGDAAGTLETLKPLLESGNADARVYALAGSAHARRGDYKTSQAFLEKAANGAPKEQSLRTQLAMTRIAQGDDAGAAAMLQNVLKTNGKSLEALMMVSLVNLRQQKYKEALATADQIVAAYPALPVGFNMRGAAQLGMNDSKAAEASFRQALVKKPNFIEARRNLAQLLSTTGRREEAKKQLLQVLTINRNDTTAMTALADIARAQNNSAERINWLKQATAIAPKNIAPRVSLTQAYVQSGDSARALAEASAMERDFGDNPTVIELVGITQLTAKQPGKAESSFNRLVTLAPNMPGPRILLARTQAFQGRVEDARSTYAQALTLTGQNLVPVYVDAIALESRSGDYPAALALVARLRRAYPKLNVADQVVGDINLNSGDLNGAVASYQAAQRINFDRSVAMRLSVAYDRMNRTPNAIAILQAFLKKEPNDPVAMAGLADRYTTARNYKQAIAIYDELRKRGAANDPAVLNNLAWALHKLRDKRAIPMAQAAIRAAPTSPAIMDTAGIVLVETGTDVKRGLALLQKGVATVPRDPNMRYHLAIAYKANGKKADAISELNLALKAAKWENRAAAAALLQSLRR